MFSKRSHSSGEDTPRRRRVASSGESTNRVPLASGQYRRNQTLSSYKHATHDDSERQKAHTLTRQRRKLGGTLLIVFGAVVFLSLLLWQLIAQVHITSSTKQLAAPFESARYEEVVHQYFLLNPAQRLKFLLNEESLNSFAAAQLPELEAITLKGSPGIAEADFSVTFRTPVAGWQIHGQQYYVDASGVVFERNYYAAPDVQVVDESGVRPEQGIVVAGSRLLAFLGKIVTEVGERGYVVSRAVLPQDTTREMDIYVTATTTRVKLSIDRGAGEQAEDMQRALQYLQEHGQVPEYVDVRVEGRAAYR